MKRWSIGCALAVVLLLASTSTWAITLAPVNLVDLIHDSDAILVGTVSSVTDGTDGAYGLPCTEPQGFSSRRLEGFYLTPRRDFERAGILLPPVECFYLPACKDLPNRALQGAAVPSLTSCPITVFTFSTLRRQEKES